MNETIGAILAGGRATRMGRDKAFVSFRGTPMISHVAQSLHRAGLRVLVVGRAGDPGGLQGVPDHGVAGRGPMAGLVTALRAASGNDVFLVAVDQPLLRPETIVEMLSLPGDAVVPMADGHPQVTCALYRSSCLQPAETALDRGEMKLRRMLDTVEPTYVAKETWSSWGEDGRSWLSMDTAEAVAAAEDEP